MYILYNKVSETELEMDVLSVSSSEEDMKLVDKDTLSKLYCIDLLSKDKICKELHITAETLNYNLSYYNLERDTTQVRAKRQKNGIKQSIEIKFQALILKS